ncbi:MAG: alcohol dehydrogenase catalytic domain-containing protein, partial [Litorilinea sp.]
MREYDALPVTMHAARLGERGATLVEDYPVPRPGVAEAAIRVHLAGICATDLQLLAGYKGGYRGVLGHEFVGTVVQVGANPLGGMAPRDEFQHWLGQRVVGELNIGCGTCGLCRRGLGKHCRRRQSLGIIGRDGAFAHYLTLPVANLHVVPPEIPDRVAVFAEPLAAALEILEQVHIAPATRVIVVGDGRLGQLIARVLALTGCDLTVVGRHAEKLALLTAACAGQARISSPALLEELAADPADVVVDATGRAAGFATARRLVRPGGTLVLKSTFAEPTTAVDLSSLVVDEVRVVGSRCGPFAPALRLLAAGRVDVEPLISAEYPLDLATTAL